MRINLQFAYKLNTSTVQCISSIMETISYYIDKKVTYLSALLTLQKLLIKLIYSYF